MILSAMIACDEDALFCDLAETYHIIGLESQPVEVIARLSAGLREDSRIWQKMNDVTWPPLSLMAAHITDELKLFRYGFLDAKELPYLFLEHLKNEEEKEGFDSPEEFLKKWKENEKR